MRIIGGKYRGLKLCEFDGVSIRPTSDRVKENIFNIIAPSPLGERVLDLFCGSGNIGAECLSRGAAEVHFNDFALSSIAVLKKNLAKLKGENNYIITNSDYASCLAGCKGGFDFIYIDPPYALNAGEDALEIIAARGLLNDGGIAVYERDREFTGSVDGLEICDKRRYGKVYLTFFRPAAKEL